eukprot:8829923-Alexandrium_andersonii.AAC.1
MHTIFTNGGLVLDKAEAGRAVCCCEYFWGRYTWLLKRSWSMGVRNYGIYFKFHALWRIAYHSKYFNRTKIWCYECEDFMHVVVSAAKARVAGSQLRTVGNKVLSNWLL